MRLLKLYSGHAPTVIGEGRVKTQYSILSLLFMPFVFQGLALAVTATTTAPVSPPVPCSNPVNMNGLLYQPTSGSVTVDHNGDICPTGQWQVRNGDGGDEQIAVSGDNTKDANGNRHGDQRVAVRKEGGHVVDIVTVLPLRSPRSSGDGDQKSVMEGLGTPPQGWGDWAKNGNRSQTELAKAANYVSVTHFDTTDSSGTLMVSQTQCFAGSCLNINKESCKAFYAAMDEQLKIKKLPPLKSYADLAYQVDMCNAVGHAGVRAEQKGWDLSGATEPAGKKLYDHDLDTLRKTKAVTDNNRGSGDMGFKIYKAQNLLDSARNLVSFSRGCEIMAANNLPAGGRPAVDHPAAPAARTTTGGATR